jgi:hypothetical protein
MEYFGDEVAKLEDELKTKLPGDHNCDQSLQIRLRFISNTPKGQYVRQCLVCGRQKRGPVSEKSALIELNGRLPDNFDSSIEERINTKRRSIFDRLEEIRREKLERESPTAVVEFEDYLQQRSNIKIQINSTIDAAIEAVVGGSQKEHVADLFLRRLAPLRRELRTARASKVSRFSSEIELKIWVESWLETDFIVHKEVTGTHVSTKIGVVIDYVIFPRQHLIHEGFIAGYVGLEVKYISQDSGFSRKASRGLWQTISYTDSVFALDGKERLLSFALLFSNLSFQAEQDLLETFRGHHHTENDQAEWRAMLLLANHANVGTLRMLGEREVWRGWNIFLRWGLFISHALIHEVFPNTISGTKI